eukprot:GHVU01218982.1.p1 GENE.GHVU01218982.1~~GHVU01218982.1.p1  ORF type:complete len:751 (-),score=52.34 GHVU01218982.1:111-2363(-)
MGKKWKSIKISIDLLQASGENLHFLKDVASHPQLQEEQHISNASRRYEQLWLPLLKTNSGDNLLPPLDVHWVWYVHMLSPKAYQEDCMRLIGKVAGHKFYLKPHEQTDAENQTRLHWDEMYGATEPFDSPKIIPDFQSQLSYDIKAASNRQMSFFYNVSLPHYHDEHFRSTGVERYKKFLHLKCLNRDLFTVPMYDVDLIWHTHQAHPLAYARDTKAIFGHILNHDDTTTDRSPGSFLSQSDTETRAAWQHAYKENFPIPGVMYRGKSPAGKLKIVPSDALDEIFPKLLSFSVEKIELNGNLPPQYENLYCTIRCPPLIHDTCVKGEKYTTHVIKRSPFQWPTQNKTEIWSFTNKHVEQHGLYIHVKQKKIVGGKDIAALKQELMKGTTEELLGMHTFRISENLPEDVEATVETKVTATSRAPVILSLVAGSYEECVIPQGREQLWGPILVSQGPNVGPCFIASHKLTVLTEVHFTAQVIHSRDQQMSAVQIYFQDKMVALGHLIGADQLPSPSQVNTHSRNAITLEKSLGERAMIIKNSQRDWGIIKASWTGMKQAKRDCHGSPGYLTAHFYNLVKEEHFSCQPKLDTTNSVSIEGIKINFGDGKITVDDKVSDEVAEHLALGFCLSVLHVLCEPRPDIATLGKPRDYGKPMYEPKVLDGQDVTPYELQSGYLPFVAAAGYWVNTPCNSFWYWNDHTCTGEKCAFNPFGNCGDYGGGGDIAAGCGPSGQGCAKCGGGCGGSCGGWCGGR